uniref:Uncharacterized protein n=1 Tax=Candidatus Kentrum sp. DK TaxID=2126562 RepID=A0A450RYK7_9GAMM|nr:MAG: hypothetical protein BECKDK2373C_GA0170839_100755 [Candidatus Kentron sp. DK]
MSLRPDDRRFLILLGVVFIAVVTLTMAARFLGSVLWPEESPVAETIPAEPASRPPPSGARQSAHAPPPKAPPVRVTVEGSIPPEFVGLEGRLTTMERDLSSQREQNRALREKVAAADALILRAEGGAPGDSAGLMLPARPAGKREGLGADDALAADATRPRQRPEAPDTEGKRPNRGSTP